MSEDSSNQSQDFDPSIVQELRDQVEALQKELAESKEDKETKKIKAIVSEEVKQFKKEKLEYDIHQAHKIYDQAVENERLAREERENRVAALRETKIERIKKDMIEQIKTIKYMIDNKHYPQDFFSSVKNDSKTQQMRDFYYRLYHEAEDPEKFVDQFIERHKRSALIF